MPAALGQQRAAGRLDLDAGGRDARPYPALRIRLIGDRAAFDEGCLPGEQLIQAPALVDGSSHQHHRRLRLGRLEEGLELIHRARGGVALALRRDQRFGLKDDDDAPRHHHRHGADGVDERRHAIGELVARRHVAGVNALDVERLEAFLDQTDELRRERRLLDVVLALQQVKGISAAGESACGPRPLVAMASGIRTPPESR